MPHFVRWVFFCLAAGITAGCSLPHGAPQQSTVLAGSEAKDAPFAVVAVNAENLPYFSHWPNSSGSLGYSWLGNGGGSGTVSIKPGDTLDVVVWDSQQNSLLANQAQKTVDIKGLRVSPAGDIFLPYVEEVHVAGLTAEEVRDTLQTELEPIVPAAQVQVAITPGNGNIVDLVSGVQNPGRFPITEPGLTVLSLVSQGGGISPDLRNPIVRLQRGGHTYTVPSNVLFENPSMNVEVRGGDKVVVQEDQRYFIALGASGREEMTYFPKDEVSALDALALIGGLNDTRADLRGVLVMREYPADAVRADGSGPPRRQVVFSFDLTNVDGLFAARNFKINPRDVVLATESPVQSATTIFGLMGSGIGIANAAF